MAIKTNGLGKVISNNLWAKPHTLQGGFGIDYLQGITTKVDAVSSINASWVDYKLPSGINYGSSNFLLDINTGAHIKLLVDKHTFSPFLIAKAGYTSYKNFSGVSLLPGAGLQVNLFNEAFLLTTIEYRYAINNKLTNQLYYSIGIAAPFSKRKPAAIVLPKEPIAKDTVPVVFAPEKIEQPVEKNIEVVIIDEATKLPLQYAVITLKDSVGNAFSTMSNAFGKAYFSAVKQAAYQIGGMLNDVAAAPAIMRRNDFVTNESTITIQLIHNDPRFTLVGNTVDVNTKLGIEGAQVVVKNTTNNSESICYSLVGNGEFRSQLESESDFVIVGKKANYISNIENTSTKGFNRSTTLYVKLQLGIQEAGAGKTIILNKIYFETGKAILDIASSADLDRLVQFLMDNPGAKLEIQGHTDNIGSLLANNKLSLARANSVVIYLVKKGVAENRLSAKGFGPTMPVSNNSTKEGRAQNRRVEMKVL